MYGTLTILFFLLADGLVGYSCTPICPSVRLTSLKLSEIVWKGCKIPVKSDAVKGSEQNMRIYPC